MTRFAIVRAAAVSVLLGAVTAAAQTPAAKNPLDGNADAIRSGMGLFRSRCADCHGMDARGIRSPDLTQVWASGRTDAGLFQTLRRGVAGTEMPAFTEPRTSEEDIWKILAYLRTLATPTPADIPPSDVAHGERIYRAQCASCHRVNGRGGRVGPDLSRVGLSRPRASVVAQLRGKIDRFKDGYAPVTLTPEVGQPVRGVKKNEDAFSVQIMDSGERIQGYLKSDLRGMVNEQASAMPVFGPDRLSDADLNDLLGYLATLRGFDPSASTK